MSDFADDEDTFILDKEYFDRDHLTAASLLTLAEEIDGNVKIEDSFGRVIFFEDITKTQLLDDISII